MKFLNEVTGEVYEFLDDFMGNVLLPDGSYAPYRVIFPEIKKVNHYAGYVVLKDNTIRCSLEANPYIAQYQGCDESEVNIWAGRSVQ